MQIKDNLLSILPSMAVVIFGAVYLFVLYCCSYMPYIKTSTQFWIAAVPLFVITYFLPFKVNRLGRLGWLALELLATLSLAQFCSFPLR